ncbi:MAG: hypothetical protein ACKV0T_13645 [Planctomycetales bacterium]
MKLMLALIPRSRRAKARQAFQAGDAVGFLTCASNTDHMAIVSDNLVQLKERGIFEQALSHTFTRTRVNHFNWDFTVLDNMFELADPAKLRACGDELPGDGPFTLYRGVCGTKRYRRRRGYSWTFSLDSACWYACRLPRLDHPEVVTATVSSDNVLVFMNNRFGEEAIVRPWRCATVEMPTDEMRERAEAKARAFTRQHEKRMAELMTNSNLILSRTIPEVFAQDLR